MKIIKADYQILSPDLDDPNCAGRIYRKIEYAGRTCYKSTDKITDDMDVEVCYVSRPYLTRHGAGPLPEECSREMLGARIDLTNHDNEWQGSLRYGRLDLKELILRCVDDCRKFGEKDNVYWTLAMTHCDEISEFTDSYEKGYFMAFIEKTHIISPRYGSFGPKQTDVRILAAHAY